MLPKTMKTCGFISCFSVLLLMSVVIARDRTDYGSTQLNLAGSAKDVAALIAFKKEITSNPSGALINWGYDGNHFCNWTGVQCNIHKWRVIGLDLRNMSLEGTISSQLGNMSFLNYLNLSLNRLRGDIPTALGRLGRLKVLYLNRNLLEGSIPSALGDCLRLKELHLSKNNFKGSIPHQLGRLRNLQVLSSWGSGLTGAIPKTLGNCSMLQLVDLSDNNLTGTIPVQLGSLTRLQRLQLEQNRLTGQIPPHLLNCSDLRNLSLWGNGLSGPIPSHIGAKLPKLQFLNLWNNKLNGSIPKSLGNCTDLLCLELGQNELIGIIPQELGNLLNLKDANFYSNRFVSGSPTTAPILDALSNCSELRRLDLSFNRLTGTLPKAVGQFSRNLTYLSLEGNRFKGKIPEEIGNLTSLTELYLSRNSLVGSIPLTIGSLANLHAISLALNKLEGNIPSEIDRMENLEYVFLYDNLLSGKIPKVLGNLRNLRQLDLSINKFYGTIPPEIGNCAKLEFLDVSYNNLRGNIPLEVAKFRNLELYLNLSNNELTGSVPAQLGGMQMVQAIDLSANKLSGAIPDGISFCVELQYLNLSHNQLEGTVPTSMGLELRSLQDIDLSFNNLSGPIPSSMVNLSMLSHINLSYNNLVGPIPCVGAFKNLSITSFIGNPKLCGKWLGIAACSNSSKTDGHRDSIKKKILILLGPIFGIVAACCFGLGFWICFRIRKRTSLKSSSLKLGKFKISREELSRATEDYNTRNLIGVGSYGSVYRGVLPGSNTVAVKVFTNLNSEAADKCFDREFQTLSKARHPNLVEIIASCSTVDFRALVLQFMSNGSLDKHLHVTDHNQNGQTHHLSLKMRLNILWDVAHGMSYLHHDCCPSIVHCDLKPENVLLNENMRAHVADFGIARLANASDEASTTTSTFKGSIGYVPPEYGLGGRVRTKGDVYSYGILVLEMITGKRPTDEMFGGHGLTLPGWVSQAFPHRLKHVIDSSLLEEISNEGTAHEYVAALHLMAQVGIWCSCKTPENRPTMRDVEDVLRKIVGADAGISVGQ